MAKIIYNQPGQPPSKKKYIPNSIKYKKMLLVSAVLNIIQLIVLFYNLV